MSNRFRISEVDCIVIDQVQHMLESQTDEGIVLRPCDGSQARREFSYDALIKLLSQPHVEYRRGYFASAQAARRLRNDQQYLSTLPVAVQDKLLWKESYCRAFKILQSQGRVVRTLSSIDRAMPELSQMVNTLEDERQKQHGKKPVGSEIILRRPPGTNTLRSWIRLYDRNGQNALALLRKRRSDTTYSRKFSVEVEQLLAECVNDYLALDRPSQLKIIERTKSRFERVNSGRIAIGEKPLLQPSARSISRRIRALDPFQVYAARYGFDAAKRHFGLYEDGIKASYPMERIEMDEWNVDVISLFGKAGALDANDREQRRRYDIGRRWIYVAIDCATRCVVSFLLVDNPAAEQAVRALEFATKDKTSIAEAARCRSSWHYHGGIGSIVTDQGSAFTSIGFRTAVTDLGSTYEAPPAGVPKLRSTVERIFGTFGGQLAGYLSGRTFSTPEARGDYPSEKLAALTDDELAEIFVTFIVDVYHNTPHVGLKDETPANAWKRLSAERYVTAPPDATTQRAVFGIPVERDLGRHGVRVHGINYSCPELQDALLRGRLRQIPVRVDPDDISAVTVDVDGKYVTAQAVTGSVEGLSLAAWQDIVFNLRAKHGKEAQLTEGIVREARARIMEIDRRARELMRIQPKGITAEDLERAESQLFYGLNVKPRKQAPARSRIGQDLLSDVIDGPFPEELPDARLNEPPKSTPSTPVVRFFDD